MKLPGAGLTFPKNLVCFFAPHPPGEFQTGAGHTFGTHRLKKCRKRLLFGVIYFYQTFKTTSLENIPYGPFGVANLELATFSL